MSPSHSAGSPGAAVPDDVLISGGTLIDPALGVHARRGVWIRGGKVVRTDAESSHASAATTLAADECIVVPGLVDLHGHFFRYGFPTGIGADTVCPPSGVTTAVDAGSAGFVNYASLLEHEIRPARTRLRAFLNLGGLGLGALSVGLGEISLPELIRVPEMIACIEANRDTLLGVKLRVDERALGSISPSAALSSARAVADATATRIMVHVTGSPVPLAEILDHLGPGDIVTHVYHGRPNGLLDERRRVVPAAIAARNRGVLFDTGSAIHHFDVHVAAAGAAQDFWPDTLSTDVHRAPPERRVYRLVDIMSHFVALGMPLDRAVAAVTSVPGQVVGAGTLAVGGDADVAVLRWVAEPFTMTDGAGQSVTFDRHLEPVHVLLDGDVWPMNASYEQRS